MNGANIDEDTIKHDTYFSQLISVWPNVWTRELDASIVIDGWGWLLQNLNNKNKKNRISLCNSTIKINNASFFKSQNCYNFFNRWIFKNGRPLPCPLQSSPASSPFRLLGAKTFYFLWWRGINTQIYIYILLFFVFVFTSMSMRIGLKCILYYCRSFVIVHSCSCSLVHAAANRLVASYRLWGQGPCTCTFWVGLSTLSRNSL